MPNPGEYERIVKELAELAAKGGKGARAQLTKLQLLATAARTVRELGQADKAIEREAELIAAMRNADRHVMVAEVLKYGEASSPIGGTVWQTTSGVTGQYEGNWRAIRPGEGREMYVDFNSAQEAVKYASGGGAGKTAGALPRGALREPAVVAPQAGRLDRAADAVLREAGTVEASEAKGEPPYKWTERAEASAARHGVDLEELLGMGGPLDRAAARLNVAPRAAAPGLVPIQIGRANPLQLASETELMEFERRTGTSIEEWFSGTPIRRTEITRGNLAEEYAAIGRGERSGQGTAREPSAVVAPPEWFSSGAGAWPYSGGSWRREGDLILRVEAVQPPARPRSYWEVIRQDRATMRETKIASGFAATQKEGEAAATAAAVVAPSFASAGMTGAAKMEAEGNAVFVGTDKGIEWWAYRQPGQSDAGLAHDAAAMRDTLGKRPGARLAVAPPTTLR